MNTRFRTYSAVFIGLLAIGAYAGCSAEGPSTPSPVVSDSGQLQSFGFSGLNVDEDFNCTNTGQVHVRFSDPGWVNDNVVGLYVNFAQVEDTNMELRVAWDFDGAPNDFKVIPLEDADVTRRGGRLDVEKVIEHTYRVDAKTKKRVRVELTLADQVGNCARVREVTVAPPVPTVSCNVTTGVANNLKAEGGGAGINIVVLPGDFVFPFAPGTPLPNNAVPVSIRANPKPGTAAGEWKYVNNGRPHMAHGKEVHGVAGGSCGIPVRKTI